jgi:hypothetical protein
MLVLPGTPTTRNPPEHFTGDVWLDPIASPRDEGRSYGVSSRLWS